METWIYHDNQRRGIHGEQVDMPDLASSNCYLLIETHEEIALKEKLLVYLMKETM